MKNILYICLLFLFSFCKKNDKINHISYQTKIVRDNSCEFDGLVFKSKVFMLNKDLVLSTLITAQKLDHETEKDTIFANGQLIISNKKNKTYITTKEKYMNGYDKFTTIDSIIRNFEQLDDGTFKLLKISHYRSGQEITHF